MNKTWIETIEKLISEIEDYSNSLEQEQDLYEGELSAYDPNDEGSFEPEEVDNSEALAKLNDVLINLNDAKDGLKDD